mmetsp:Transcript_43683/g.86165  ORF Transcript_43683/g.86165 Transcript_43683/m.86165 type:complete len:82 (-) Transcript_43683:907-1152(-)
MAVQEVCLCRMKRWEDRGGRRGRLLPVSRDLSLPENRKSRQRGGGKDKKKWFFECVRKYGGLICLSSLSNQLSVTPVRALA